MSYNFMFIIFNISKDKISFIPSAWGKGEDKEKQNDKIILPVKLSI